MPVPPSEPASAPHVVVGGGISGLAAAHRLRERRPGLRVIVYEAAPSLGGKLAQAEVAGLLVDTGAESVLNRRPEAVDLIRAVGLGDDLCHPVTSSASVWSRGRLRSLPPTVLGVPIDSLALARSGVLPPWGVTRAALDRVLPGRAPAGDVAVGDFITRRLGLAVTERLLEPLLGGVYAGHADRLSLRAAAPQVAHLAAHGGSLLAAASRGSAARAAAASLPVFAGVAGGVGRLPQAVADSAGAELHTSSAVRELRRIDRDASGGRWQLVVGRADAPTLVEAAAVLLATPAAPTARLLEAVAPGAAAELRGVEAASVAVVTLALPVAAPPPYGSGFLVPPVEGRAVKAVTWSSRKWGWLGERAGAGTLLLRASFGRAGETALLQRDDDELVRLAVDELADLTGLSGPPLDARVTRWGGGLPQYAVGHRDRVARVRAALRGVPGLDVCGATYDGVGIAACVADARAAADRVVDDLDQRATMRP